MDEKVKQQWVQALRSGKYRQATGALGTTRNGATRHCCLGVLCDLAVKAGVIPEPTSDADSQTEIDLMYGVGDDSHGAVLPDAVVDWAGLDHFNPIAGQVTLSTANDDGANFAEIADIIEEQL